LAAVRARAETVPQPGIDVFDGGKQLDRHRTIEAALAREIDDAMPPRPSSRTSEYRPATAAWKSRNSRSGAWCIIAL